MRQINNKINYIRKMKEKDMTIGKPGKLILGFAASLFIGNICQQIYTFTDTLIVGNKIGIIGLTALGVTGERHYKEFQNSIVYIQYLGA